MAANVTSVLPKREDAAVFDWRYSELLRCGYSANEALQLASDRNVDLHVAERLLVNGCAPRTAVRILL